MPGSFLDTNVLVYLAQSDADKAERVEQLLKLEPVVSVQVLNELANVLRPKAAFSWSETRRFLTTVRDLTTVISLTTETHELGLAIAERFMLSIYDAMIVAAAQTAECNALWSEDMQHGLRLESGLEIRNPFRG
jgi:predicted nucleic acid-binding protein